MERVKNAHCLFKLDMESWSMELRKYWDIVCGNQSQWDWPWVINARLVLNITKPLVCHIVNRARRQANTVKEKGKLLCSQNLGCLVWLVLWLVLRKTGATSGAAHVRWSAGRTAAQPNLINFALTARFEAVQRVKTLLVSHEKDSFCLETKTDAKLVPKNLVTFELSHVNARDWWDTMSAPSCDGNSQIFSTNCEWLWCKWVSSCVV